MNEELRLRTDESNRLNALMETIFSSLHAAMVVLDRRLRVTIWSGRARNLWGLLDEEVVGESFFDLDMGLPREGLRKLVEGCRDGTVEHGEAVVEAVNRRGQAIQCRVLCSPFSPAGGGPAGEPRGVILMMEDRTVHPPTGVGERAGVAE